MSTHDPVTCGSDDEWEDDPSGFEEALSQGLDQIASSQSQPEAKEIPDTVATQSDDKENRDDDDVKRKSPVDPIAEADAISATGCVIDPRLQELDPYPDIERLFRIFDKRFFAGSLQRHKVTVRWSNQMSLCAGKCDYYPKTRVCIIKMSEPLVRKAPRKNRVETLLHEMIHAELFVTDKDDDHDEHGPRFTHHMARINTLGQCYVTLRHTFDIKWRIWQCDGPCSKKPPNFGRVQKSNDKPPGPEMDWFQKHQETCGGQFHKVNIVPKSERDNKKPATPKGKKAPKNRVITNPASHRITDYFKMVKGAKSPSTRSPKSSARKSTGSLKSKEKCDAAKQSATSTEIITLD